MPLTDEHKQYLADHNLAILGTGKRDGSPQLSTIYYDWDGERIYISVTSDRAKWKNAVRQPNVALVVPDGRKQLIVYGTARGITDPDERNAAYQEAERMLAKDMPSIPLWYSKEFIGFSNKIESMKQTVFGTYDLSSIVLK